MALRSECDYGDAGGLTISGWNEMQELGQRLQAAFPTLLPSTYSRDHYYFRSSNVQGPRHSLIAFANGLFGDNGHEKVYFEDAPEPDLFLRSYMHCPEYTHLNEDRTEVNAFIAGPEYQQMVMQVSARLGFHGSNVLRTSEVAFLASQCKYEQLWSLDFRTKSPICAAFSVANAQVIEFLYDVDWYQRLGYGRPNHRKLHDNMGCFFIQDMIRFIQSNDGPRTKLLTAHLGVYLILLHFDAFAGEDPPNRHNLAQQTQRIWRTTHSLSMASNLVVVRYE